MLVKLPAVFSVNEKSKFGGITQLIKPESVLNCNAVRYTVEKSSGYVLTGDAGEQLFYIFSSKPKAPSFAPTVPILIAKNDTLEGDEVDLTHGQWWEHPDSTDGKKATTRAANTARLSWWQAFNFALEDPALAIIGLRKPQLGALHAIHAHWSTSSETATIVMPTGTGKTETMLSVLISARCERVLVVVPTDALRTQIAEKFETLGVLKTPNNRILEESAHRPVVGRLTSGPTSPDDVDSFFEKCNVIVTTSQLVGLFSPEIQQRIVHWCTHLFIDEAHHAEAPTWRVFREHFNVRPILQFTATPFREDGQKIDGKLIYVYPLKAAQEEGYFRPIRFHPVNEFNAAKGDRKIAEAALNALDEDSTGKHIVMARVDSRARAETIFELYRSFSRYEAVMIHSGMKANDIRAEKQKLFNGSARVVVCVDMLGEGFDLPELKIAAFHDIRKSLSITLQLAGRFTRARQDLGDPVFIANIALVEVREQLRRLYTQEPDWNSLLPELSSSAIDEELLSQEFFQGFEAFLDEVPLKDLRPAASMVVYKTNCTQWTPKKFRKGFRGLSARDKLFHSLNHDQNTLVVLAATERSVRWSDVESVREMTWELFIAIWDSSIELLYLHGSGINGEYKELAKVLCGSDVQLVVAPQVFRSFHGVNRLVMNNVGLEEHLGRQVRYTGRMGSDVEARIGQAARRTAKRSVLAGTGYEGGEKVSVGAAKRGRVWSNLRLRVDSFSDWARALGRKIANDEIDSDVVLEGTLKPKAIGATPVLPAIAVDWPKEILERQEVATLFSGPKIEEISSTYVDIQVEPRADDEPILIRIFSPYWESVFRLELSGSEDDSDFKFEHIRGVPLRIRLGGRDEIPVEEFLTAFPPTIWFADGSSLEGCEFTQLPSTSLLPFRTDQLILLDWTGVDITSESQGEAKKSGTIQHKIIELLQTNPTYRVIFDDDGAGEAADVVTIRIVEEEVRTYIEVELYHLKYSKEKPGGRIDDLYVVCGQAQRSVSWLLSHQRRTELFTHLLKRDDLRVDAGKSTRFERGTAEALLEIRDMSRRLDVRLKVYVVQPGLSKKAASESQLRLLAVSERYLSDTYEVPFSVMCSE
jgi:superfamily II DNA or RNA helicase